MQERKTFLSSTWSEYGLTLVSILDYSFWHSSVFTTIIIIVEIDQLLMNMFYCTTRCPGPLARVYYSIKVLALAKWLTPSPARFKVRVRHVDYTAISGSPMCLQTQMDRSENKAKYFIGSNCSTAILIILCGWQLSGCEVLLPACILSLTPHSDHGKQDIVVVSGLLWQHSRARIENISYQNILWTLSFHEWRAEAIWL